MLNLINQLFGNYNKIISGDISQETHTYYNLTELKKILDNDEVALQQVIKTFVGSTNSNLDSLEKSIKENDIENIKEISHKMAPMFMQIKADNIITILDKMEHLETRKCIQALELDFRKLNEGIATIFQDFKKNTIF